MDSDGNRDADHQGPRRREPETEGRDIERVLDLPSFKNNPFDLNKPKLKQQSELIERNPMRAREMILAAGRDPKLFGFA